MAGIKETKEALELVFALVDGVVASMDDGKFSLMDLTNFYSAVTLAPSAINGANSIRKEMADLDEYEKQELITFIKDKFDIPQDKIEERIETGLAVAIHLMKMLNDAANE